VLYSWKRFRPLSLLALLLCVCLMPLLQACGGSSNANGTITIKVAYQQFGPPPYPSQVWWNSVKKNVEAAHPNIKVQLEPIIADEGSYYTKLDLMLRSPSTAPDLVMEDSFLIGSDVTAGYLQPLDSYLAQWPAYKQQWYPSMQKITTFNGHNYGVMYNTDVRGIWYNKSIFQKAGLPTNWQPRTWADILSAAQTIKSKVPGVIPMNLYSGVPMDEASSMQGFEMLLYGTKDPLYDYQTNKWVTSSPGFRDALNFVKQVYNPANLLGPTNDIALSTEAGNTMSQQLLPQGKLAIDIDGSWLGGTWNSTGQAPWPQWSSTMGVAKMPTEFGQAPNYVTLSGGWGYSIAAQSKHKDDAFMVLQTAFNLQDVGTFDVQSGSIATRQDITKLPSYANLPYNALFTSMLTFTQYRPAFPAYPKVSVQIDNAMQHVMSGQSADAAMSSYAQSVQGIVGAGSTEQHP